LGLLNKEEALDFIVRLELL